MRSKRQDASSCEGLREDLSAITNDNHVNPCLIYQAMKAYLRYLEECKQPGSRHEIEKVWRESVFQGYRCQEFKAKENMQQPDTKCYKEVRVSSR